ncbi:HPr family phosphocarrier protein [Alishewanella sp. 16-MA]|uniref:HPr family phosphocarrier protein n=1 Tax=Alishewanella maricola TaxID=2795740 RepID=A0ABS8BYV8_9ALTE|nr:MULTISPECIES: HPr family phosphocarrier protein [Alishewanella]MDP4944378.1 HPr family phosphocarrier protein [Alishewanella sp.]MDP5205671.1 HPr family phosphocarrier protein [Alishewanella sp. SMS9]MCB5225254.1 HPr family phosphocarrier protein [Alishewanella maricola]MDP5036305.1 HPr family phosphocarrier protein [Alishewanella sp.]MDP5188237.1 HPr family phosphocarrier protein [Alishewanella sp.]
MADKLAATVTIINALGLHARAATKLVQLSQQFDAKVELVQEDGKTADAGSVLALLMMASSKGKTLTVTTEGPDAAEALDAITLLINTGFGE